MVFFTASIYFFQHCDIYSYQQSIQSREPILFFFHSMLHIFANFPLKQFWMIFRFSDIPYCYRHHRLKWEKKNIFWNPRSFRNDCRTCSVFIISLYELTYSIFSSMTLTISHVITHISITAFVLFLSSEYIADFLSKIWHDKTLDMKRNARSNSLIFSKCLYIAIK